MTPDTEYERLVERIANTEKFDLGLVLRESKRLGICLDQLDRAVRAYRQQQAVELERADLIRARTGRGQ